MLKNHISQKYRTRYSKFTLYYFELEHWRTYWVNIQMILYEVVHLKIKFKSKKSILVFNSYYFTYFNILLFCETLQQTCWWTQNIFMAVSVCKWKTCTMLLLYILSLRNYSDFIFLNLKRKWDRISSNTLLFEDYRVGNAIKFPFSYNDP